MHDDDGTDKESREYDIIEKEPSTLSSSDKNQPVPNLNIKKINSRGPSVQS